MDFDISKIARKYVYDRFPEASYNEKEKIIKDWERKKDDSVSLVKDFKKRVCDPSGLKILDVGSGNGGISIAFAKSGATVSGVDIEEELFNISKLYAQSENVDVDLRLYDGDVLPYEDNYFDAAISASVIEHTTDPVFYLNQILRVVKVGGYLYLGFPNKYAFRETHTRVMFLTYLPRFLRPYVLRFLKRNPLEENNLHFYSYFDLEEMINKISSDYKWQIVPEEGETKNKIKIFVKKVLNLFGLSYKIFLPHILVVLKKVENK